MTVSAWNREAALRLRVLSLRIDCELDGDPVAGQSVTLDAFGSHLHVTNLRVYGVYLCAVTLCHSSHHWALVRSGRSTRKAWLTLLPARDHGLWRLHEVTGERMRGPMIVG